MRLGARLLRQVLAWCAHLYTAMGLVAAAGIAVAILYEQYHYAFLLMFVATVIDATDGTFARAVKVKEVLPHFDGRRLDDLIDFHTYTTLPLFLIWRAGVLPEEWQGWLIAPLLASAYGFCQTNAKTDDGYFLGFPSYWNIIAFYLYALNPPPAFSLAVLLFFALMTFLPARYLYPTHRGRLNRYTNLIGAVWGILMIGIVTRMPVERPFDPTLHALTLASLAFPIYYLVVSWIITARIVVRAIRQHAAHRPSPDG